MLRPAKRTLATLGTLAATLAAALLAVPAAAAAPGGTTTVKPGGRAHTTLRSQGVRITAGRPVRARRGRFFVPVRGGELANVTVLRHAGALVFRRGRRALRLTRIELRLGRRSQLTVRAGRLFLTLARVRSKGRLVVKRDSASVRLRAARLDLTREGAALIARRLRLARVPRGTLGTVAARARLDPPPLPGSGRPVSGPIDTDDLPLLARPVTAVAVTDVSIRWHPRDSWLRYVSSGDGASDGIFASAGATADGPTDASPCPDRPPGTPVPLSYGFAFTPAASWYDPVSGRAGVYGRGSVRFRFADRGIDLAFASPEIEITGSASRAIFRVTGAGSTTYSNQRVDLLGLSVGTPAVNGSRRTYSLMRGRLTANGESVFAGFYTGPANDDFGCVSVAFTTP